MSEPFSIEAWYDAVTTRDLERVRAFIHPDVHYEDVPTRVTADGLDAMSDIFEKAWVSVPNMVQRPTSSFRTEQGIAAEWTATGTLTGDFPGLSSTGTTFDFRGVVVIELVDDRISRLSDYWDLASSGLA